MLPAKNMPNTATSSILVSLHDYVKCTQTHTPEVSSRINIKLHTRYGYYRSNLHFTLEQVPSMQILNCQMQVCSSRASRHFCENGPGVVTAVTAVQIPPTQEAIENPQIPSLMQCMPFWHYTSPNTRTQHVHVLFCAPTLLNFDGN